MMNVARNAQAESPRTGAVVVATVLAILSLSAIATAPARAQESDFEYDDTGVVSDFYTDEADDDIFDDSDDGLFEDNDDGLFDKDDDFFDDADDDYFDFDEPAATDDDDPFNFDAEYGQDADEWLVSDEEDYPYGPVINAYETMEGWFEDWYDEG